MPAVEIGPRPRRTRGRESESDGRKTLSCLPGVVPDKIRTMIARHVEGSATAMQRRFTDSVKQSQSHMPLSRPSTRRRRGWEGGSEASEGSPCAAPPSPSKAGRPGRCWAVTVLFIPETGARPRRLCRRPWYGSPALFCFVRGANLSK